MRSLRGDPLDDNPLLDWVMVLLSAWFVGGIYLDGWAHRHVPGLETFFTPWHAVLYSGYAAVTLFLFVSILLRRRSRGVTWRAAVPPGYAPALLGVAIFAAAGVGDLLWHELFGIEVDVEALFSPTHLLLATGGVLFVGAPLRAAWRRSAGRGRWPAFLPAMLSALFVLSLLTFMTQFSHPFVDLWAGSSGKPQRVPRSVYTINADGSGMTRLLAFPYDAAHAAWAPDGRRIAYSAALDGTLDIFILDAAGGAPRRLTTAPGNDWAAAWSPDGQRIAFTSGRDGQEQIYVMNADGTDQIRLTGSGRNIQPAWAPDGRRIAFTSRRDGNWRIYVMNPDGADQMRVTRTPGDAWRPAWSPDGGRIAYSREVMREEQIYVMQADGSAPVALTAGRSYNLNPAWSPDGRRIAFVSDRDRDWEIYTMNSDGSDPVNISHNPGTDDGRGLIAWSPDGTRLIFPVLARPRVPAYAAQEMGALGMILQASILTGLVLLLIGRGGLPAGTLTLLLTGNAALMSVLEDRYSLIPAAFVAGLVADVLLRLLRPSVDRPTALHLFAFALPAVFYAAYFAALWLEGGVWWTIHVWTGAIVMSSVAGLLLSYLLAPPAEPHRASVS